MACCTSKQRCCLPADPCFVNYQNCKLNRDRKVESAGSGTCVATVLAVADQVQVVTQIFYQIWRL